mgnify:FL=1
MLVTPFSSSEKDQTLFDISKFLRAISNKEDVRPVMTNFTAYQKEKELRILQDKRLQTLEKQLTIKTMRSLQLSFELSSSMSPIHNDDSEFVDTEEKLDQSLLQDFSDFSFPRTKLPMSNSKNLEKCWSPTKESIFKMFAQENQNENGIIFAIFNLELKEEENINRVANLENISLPLPVMKINSQITILKS